MTTYIIYSDPNDGYIRSTNANIGTAYAGSNLVVDTTGNTLFTGMNNDVYGVKYVYEAFLSFDTSVITDTDEIVDATLTTYTGYPQNQIDAWGQQFLLYNWTAPLTTAAWRTPAQLKASTLVCNNDYLFSATPFTTRVTGRDSLRANINKTAALKLVVAGNWTVEGLGYNSGVVENWIYSGNSTNKPYLTVYTTALNTMNSIGLATTVLPDGTTVSLRSNGAATPVITVGYTPLNGTFTSLGTLSNAFAINIDGVNSLSMTSDPAGNFYILGTQFNVGGSLAGQAWLRTGTTNVWTAKTPIYASMPQGNEQTIVSTALTYMEGGTDGNDKPAIYALAARGSGGNRPSFPYHVPGAGWTHDMSINVTNLKAGSGWLLHGAVNGFAYTTATGIPAFVDMVKIGPNLNATYVQRGKFGSTTVGGLHTIAMYNTGGIIKGWNTDYIDTGASKLVAVSSNVFAHVFDNEAKSLTIRFYNDKCQVLGETSILASSFYGGTIGTQWAVHYDKIAKVIRVHYVAAAGATTLNRFDVSPTTYVGVSVAAVTTAFGAAGSTNLFLRAAATTDERFVPIEGANKSSGGALSTVVYNSTIGNIAPSAPALVTRQNFDATSAATFTWKPGDTNPADYQTKYQLEISRVSDSVVVYDSGAVTSTTSSHALTANTLTNAVNYRWRVRTYDVSNTVGTWSGYGTFTTAATGTLTITAPATDNLAGIETSDYNIIWNYTQSGGQTQAQRRVRLIRTSDSAVIIDSGMQPILDSGYMLHSMESGKEYRAEVSLVNSAAISVPVVSRLITPNYSEPMTPTFDLSPKDSYIEVTITNPTPTGDRPEVIYNDIYKRRTKAGAVESDFKRIATVDNAATYRDYAVKSGASYDYRVIGRTTL